MLTDSQRNQLLHFDSGKIANAIERLKLRLRNEGFTRPGLHCVTGGFPTILGTAVTCRVKTSEPPLKGSTHFDPIDWWEAIASRPGAKIAVIHDVDHKPGQGAFVSDTHAEILRALGCQAVVTNGAVRNIPALAALPFPAFAQFTAVSHAYVHMIDFDTPVEILGLHVNPGDLIFADIHGAVSLPHDAIDAILRVAGEQASRERAIVDLCRSPQFNMESLKVALAHLREHQ